MNVNLAMQLARNCIEQILRSPGFDHHANSHQKSPDHWMLTQNIYTTMLKSVEKVKANALTPRR